MYDVQYTKRADGARTAYSIRGSGPILLFPPGFASHLDWLDEPDVRAFLGSFEQHRTVVAYDRQGTGLSDRDRTDFTIEDDIQDIEAVVGALGSPRLEIFADSFAIIPSLLFAARHPELVGKMVLWGFGYGHKGQFNLREAMSVMRQVSFDHFIRTLAVSMFPSGLDEAALQSFVRSIRMSATPDMYEKLATVAAIVDIWPVVRKVQAPCLVLHRRRDQMAPFENGQELASEIPGARFQPLEGDAHLPWVGDWQSVAARALEFLLDKPARIIEAHETMPGAAQAPVARLTPRECEVLQMIAAGRTNKQISGELVLSERTVARHITNIYGKIGVQSKAQAAVYAKDNGLA